VIDFQYCERMSWLFNAQPFNILSNMLFLALAAWIWRWPSARFHRFGLILIALASMLWHSVSTPWALALDIVAIALWFGLYACDYWRIQRVDASVLSGVFVGLLVLSASLGFALKPSLPMMSGAFIPYGLVLLALCMTKPDMRLVGIASLLALLFAIVMREADLALCTLNPYGTHFLWHLGAGLSLLAPLIALERQCDAKNAGAPDPTYMAR
jgi:hypothetical protein